MKSYYKSLKHSFKKTGVKSISWVGHKRIRFEYIFWVVKKKGRKKIRAKKSGLMEMEVLIMSISVISGTSARLQLMGNNES